MAGCPGQNLQNFPRKLMYRDLFHVREHEDARRAGVPGASGYLFFYFLLCDRGLVAHGLPMTGVAHPNSGIAIGTAEVLSEL